MRRFTTFLHALTAWIIVAVALPVAGAPLADKSARVSAPDRVTAVRLAVETLRRMGYRPTYVDDQRFFRIQCYWDITIKQITQYQDHPGAVITSRETGSKDSHETLDVLVGEEKKGSVDIAFKIFTPAGVGGSRFDTARFAAIFNGVAADEYLNRGEYEQAVNLYKLAVIVDATDAGLRNNYGVALNRSGHHEEALREFREASRLAPSEAASRNIAAVLRALHRDDEAVAAYVALVDFGTAGQILMDVGRAEEAIALLRQAANMRPTISGPWYALGSLAERLKRRNEAIASFRKAVEVDPLAGNALAKVGHYDLEDGHLRDAVAKLRASIVYFNENSTAHYDLGRAYVAEKLRKDLALAEVAILRKMDDKAASDLQTLIEATSFSAPALSGGRIVISRRPEEGSSEVESSEILSSDYAVRGRLVLDQPADTARSLVVAWTRGTYVLMTQSLTIAAGSRELGFGMVVRGTAILRSEVPISVTVIDSGEGDRPVAVGTLRVLSNVASTVLPGSGGIADTVVKGTLFRTVQENGQVFVEPEHTFYYDDENIGVLLEFSNPLAQGVRFKFDIEGNPGQVLMGGLFGPPLEANARSRTVSYNVLGQPWWRGGAPSAIQVYMTGTEKPILTIYFTKHGTRRPR